MLLGFTSSRQHKRGLSPQMPGLSFPPFGPSSLVSVLGSGDCPAPVDEDGAGHTFGESSEEPP